MDLPVLILFNPFMPKAFLNKFCQVTYDTFESDFEIKYRF